MSPRAEPAAAPDRGRIAVSCDINLWQWPGQASLVARYINNVHYSDRILRRSGQRTKPLCGGPKAAARECAEALSHGLYPLPPSSCLALPTSLSTLSRSRPGGHPRSLQDDTAPTDPAERRGGDFLGLGPGVPHCHIDVSARGPLWLAKDSSRHIHRPGVEPFNLPDPTGLQVLKKCRVSGRRHFCHPTSFQGRGCENGRSTEDPASGS